jgi:hypothetical protein
MGQSLGSLILGRLRRIAVTVYCQCTTKGTVSVRKIRVT